MQIGRPADRRARLGLVGLSGYAGEICKHLRRASAADASFVDFRGIFAIDAPHHAATLEQLAGEGVVAFDDFDAMLASDEIDGVWLPLPIPLHREMAIRAIEAGKHVMLEKPVAGSVADHLAIYDAQQQAGVEVLVGFQDIYPASTIALKRDLLAGRFGTPQCFSVCGCWPRDDAYFARNHWAGRRKVAGVAVNDSPLSNAMAHFVNLLLYLLGPTENESARVKSLACETWRTRPIETFDTCSLKLELGDGPTAIPGTVVLSHATEQSVEPLVQIDTDRCDIRWAINQPTTFQTEQATVEPARLQGRARPAMVAALGQRILEGQAARCQVADLRNSLSHTIIVDAVSRVEQTIDVEPSRVAKLAPAMLEAAMKQVTLLQSAVDLPPASARFDNPTTELLGERTGEFFAAD